MKPLAGLLAPQYEARPLRRLPMLEPRTHAFETCVYCPKLCRSACPVSNAEPRETLIPWGKMSTAYFAARGDVPLEESFAAPAWACTGCYACRDACDHKNDVAGTLLDARDAFVSNALGPARARSVIAHFQQHCSRTQAAYAALSPPTGGTGGAKPLTSGLTDGSTESRAVSAQSARGGAQPLLIGCTYARRLPDVARDAIAVAEKVIGPVRLETDCCGLPLWLAGDKKGFAAHAGRFARQNVVAVDPGCAVALRSAGANVTLLVEHVAARVSELAAAPSAPRAVRWHDPCQLGRGMGIYDAPRSVMTRVLGRAPSEFPMSRARGECSGGGGLLPLTMPEVSKTIARHRVRDAEGDEIVTGCASSLLRFRAAGAKASDIVTWTARALERPDD